PAHGLEPAVRIRGRLGDERWVERYARRTQRRFVSPTAFACARNLVLLDDQTNAPVAEPDQMLDEPLRAADAVADDLVAVDSGDRSVDQHERDAEPGQPGQVRLRPVADGGDRDALDPVSDQLLDHVALDREVGAGIAED